MNIVQQCDQMLYNMYMFLYDFCNLGKNVLDVHSYNIWLGVFLDQILLLLVVVLGLENFNPPVSEGIVIVVDIDFAGISVEGIVVIDNEQDDTEVVLI